MPENIQHSNPRPRIETLSDLVFGLALSISALSLISKPPSNPSEIIGDVIGFGFCFLILISVWMRYTSIMSVLPMETNTTMFLNIAMLFLVSIEPYLFNLVDLYGPMAQPELINNASIIFAFDMGGLMAILAFFTHQLAIEERRLISPELLRKYKQNRTFLFMSAGLFFLSVLPQFWLWMFQNIPLRFYLWFVPIIISWIRRVSEKTVKSQSNA